MSKTVRWFQRRVDDLESDRRRLGCELVKWQHRAEAAEHALPALKNDLAERHFLARDCACGDRLAYETVHRQPNDGPCWVPEDKQ